MKSISLREHIEDYEKQTRILVFNLQGFGEEEEKHLLERTMSRAEFLNKVIKCKLKPI